MFDSLGQCKWRYAIIDGIRTDIVDVAQGAHGICPLCRNELVSRKGTIRNWHWAHVAGRSCDEWYEPKGEWHRVWQDCFEKSWQEVPVSKQVNGIEKRHIADIKTSNGWTIEFQYSHLSTNDILERQEFYGEMVWVVSGIRLERDRRMGEDLMKYTQSFESPEGLKYVVARVDDLPRYDFWTTVDKFVFFDFKGGFNMQQFDDQLLCLLPREINNERLFVIVPKKRLVESFKEGRERSLLIQLLGCRKAYKKKLEEIDKRRIEELRQGGAHMLMPGPARYAITLGWVQAWLWINGKITDCKIMEGVDIAVPSDTQGWLAIHCQAEYTKENYDGDIDYVRNPPASSQCNTRCVA